jgi:hypothetical protein
METLTIHPKNKEQLTALIAMAKALKVDFETNKSTRVDCKLNHRPNAITAKTIADARKGKGIGKPITDIKAFLKSV